MDDIQYKNVNNFPSLLESCVLHTAYDKTHCMHNAWHRPVAWHYMFSQALVTTECVVVLVVELEQARMCSTALLGASQPHWPD